MVALFQYFQTFLKPVFSHQGDDVTFSDIVSQFIFYLKYFIFYLKFRLVIKQYNSNVIMMKIT